MARRSSGSIDALPPESPESSTYIEPLIAASTECVDACATLQRVAPVLPLSSPFARDLHTLFYVVSNVEIHLHHFIDRELLQVRTGDPHSREHGTRLQDALERAAKSSSVKSRHASTLLAGGIASLLHLLTVALKRLNGQLENVLEDERRGDAYAEIAAAAASALVMRRATRRVWPRTHAVAAAICALCSARTVQLRLRRRWVTQQLTRTQERLSLLLHLWGLATSVLQRAQKAKSASYLDLHSMNQRPMASRPSSPPTSNGGSGGGGSAGERERTLSRDAAGHGVHRTSGGLQSKSNSMTSIEALAASGGHGGPVGGSLGGLDGASSLMPSSRSYVQLISCPGPQGFDSERKQATRALFDTCAPWTAGNVPHAFWWDSHPVLLATQRGINAAMAAMVVSLRAVKTARHVFAGGEYALAVFLLPWCVALRC